MMMIIIIIVKCFIILLLDCCLGYICLVSLTIRFFFLHYAQLFTVYFLHFSLRQSREFPPILLVPRCHLLLQCKHPPTTGQELHVYLNCKGIVSYLMMNPIHVLVSSIINSVYQQRLCLPCVIFLLLGCGKPCSFELGVKSCFSKSDLLDFGVARASSLSSVKRKPHFQFF